MSLLRGAAARLRIAFQMMLSILPPQLLGSRVGTEIAGTPVSELNAEMQGDCNKKSY